MIPTRSALRVWLHRLATLGLVMVAWLCGMCFFVAVLGIQYPELEEVPPLNESLLVVDCLSGQVACMVLLPVMRGAHSRRVAVAACLAAAMAGFSSWALLTICYALFKVSTWGKWRWIVVIDVLTLVSLTVGWLLSYGQVPSLVDWILPASVVGSLNLWGAYRGQRTALVDSYRERAETMRREQDAVMARTRAEERTAIAREMHDTLSHRLAVISLHAGGLAVRPDLGPERVGQTAEVIQHTAQTASEELRDLLTVLREDAADRRSPTTLAEIDELLAEASRAGVMAMLECDAGLRPRLASLAPQRSAALALAVREGLGNVLKHAPSSPATVTLDESSRDGRPGVRVRVVNALAPAPSSLVGGHGLVGLDERLRLADGAMDHGAVGSNHELVAWVPWT